MRHSQGKERETRQKEKQESGREKEEEDEVVRRRQRTGEEERGSSSWVYTLRWSRYAGVRFRSAMARMAGVVRDYARAIEGEGRKDGTEQGERADGVWHARRGKRERV